MAGAAPCRPEALLPPPSNRPPARPGPLPDPHRLRLHPRLRLRPGRAQGQPLGYGDGEQPEVNLYDKNPEYHGFSSDPVVDLWNMRLAFFFGISLAIVMGSVFVHYLPDRGMRQWSRREAERRLKHLETQGLPPIAENYYDTEKIVLPRPE
ncbi:NADH dehydrogenase [ubiquinone] 1 beta subcomplex subunit 11, mitochondrial [Scyliorhinus torazame]|uniref:NADH dehydrogenase [ubiquinone] 1 beta subcomplex subunit 11, mitochondrial n=1 Tax=Scyliorhinus torazame TaxID=75743 RepID=UPI003B5CE738